MSKKLTESQDKERLCAISFFSSMIGNPGDKTIVNATSQAIYNFALPRLEQATVKDSGGKEHCALHYALYLFVAADSAYNPQKNDEFCNILMQAAIMLALEECCYKDAGWSYGSRLLFDLKKADIKLSRATISAFLAQEGSWDTNRSKNDLLNGNAAAVALYCAKLEVLCYVINGESTSFAGSEEQLEKLEGQQGSTIPEVIDFYLREFGIPYLQSVGCEDPEQKVEVFTDWLKKSDFYRAPCSTKYHLNREGGVAEHHMNVLMQLLWKVLPANKRQLGACVLAALGHDLCKVGVYQKQYKNTKTYLKEGDIPPDGAQIKQDQGGQFYWAEDYYYVFKDSMPFGHGRKSAYILHGFFPEIGEEVYSAVDSHMADAVSNPRFLQLFASNRLALNLHIADVLATYLDEYGK